MTAQIINFAEAKRKREEAVRKEAKALCDEIIKAFSEAYPSQIYDYEYDSKDHPYDIGY